MKVAVIYTGGMRSFDKCFANQQWHVLRHFPDAKFYVATEMDEDCKKASLLADKYGYKNVRGYTVTQPEMVIPKGCPDEWQPGKPYMHEPYHISVDPRAVLGQLWMLREGWRLYQETKTEDADLIIRIRPDLWFHSFEVPFIAKTGYDARLDLQLRESGIACVPWWGRFGGVNDRFALLGADAAEHYFTTYDKIPAMIEAGAPLHPETLVATSLRNGLISICDDMKAEFSTLRTEAHVARIKRETGRDEPLMRPPEITMIDLAHFKS